MLEPLERRLLHSGDANRILIPELNGDIRAMLAALSKHALYVSQVAVDFWKVSMKTESPMQLSIGLFFAAVICKARFESSVLKFTDQPEPSYDVLDSDPSAAG